MSTSVPKRAFAAVMVAGLMALTAGQIFDLDNVEEIRAGSISVHYVYYAYAGDEKGEKAGAVAEVHAALVPDVKAVEPAKPSTIAKYNLVYIVLVPAKEFDTVVNPASLCEHLFSDQDQLTHTAVFQVGADNTKVPLAASGAYYLGIANCGNTTGFRVSGQVTVKHAHGFLPAIDVHMTSLYGLWLAVYIAISAVWGCLLAAKYKHVIQLQIYFLVVSLIAVGECLVWLIFYSTWNHGGVMNNILLVAGTFTSTWKVLVLFRMAFAARFAPSKRDASLWDEEKLNLALLIWSVPAFNLSFAHFYRPSMNFNGFGITMSALPAVVCTAAVMVWIMLRMSSEVALLKEISYEAHVALLRKSQAILCLASVGAFISTLVHIFDPTLGYEPSSWGGHAVAADGVSQAVFATTLCLAMCTWRPTEALQDSEYQAQGEVAAPGEAEAIGAPAGDDDDDDDLALP
mmetsp:Transcript_66247/g.191941  ORF Transcript_66247/g.191941 Transcript_66247/m.191941 type:complete len:458 (+) Transcript_66247:96-1469(+)